MNPCLLCKQMKEKQKKRTHQSECVFCCGFLPLVGVAGLEPTASWSRTKHATKLRYTPG